MKTIGYLTVAVEAYGEVLEHGDRCVACTPECLAWKMDRLWTASTALAEARQTISEAIVAVEYERVVQRREAAKEAVSGETGRVGALDRLRGAVAALHVWATGRGATTRWAPGAPAYARTDAVQTNRLPR